MSENDEESDHAVAPIEPCRAWALLAALFGAAPWIAVALLLLADKLSWSGGGLILAISSAGAILTYRLVVRLERGRVAEAGARKRAELAARLRGEFLATVSHEIRTSLNGILGMTELTLSTELSPKQRGYLGMVKESANALLIILNDFLDFSKAESGKVVLEHRRFDLHGLIERTATLATARAKSNSLEMLVVIDPTVPRYAVGDEVRVGQLLANLITNSVKFADRVGIVIVCVEREFSPSQSEFMIRISVADSGVGIPSDKLDAIFEPYVQAEDGTARRFGGTGLGLSITRRLVELMGGTLTVQSIPQIGTRFTVTLYLGLSSESIERFSAERQHVDGDGGCEVLIVDDNPVNQMLLSSLLAKRGVRSVVAKNGVEAVRAIEARLADEAREPFRMILMDCQMPLMDGFEATAQIRKIEAGRGGGTRSVIVALTGNALDGAQARCEAAGMDGYLPKPIDLGALEELLHRFAPATQDSEVQSVRPR